MMLRLEQIKKDYKVADTTVHALKGIDLSFRKNEFVSILGPSGCGKTTLLNIIGGLDQYTSGNLFINGISTKKFKDRDWDVYRNHRIGFIFQSYNLIPHQTILGNVELALTIAGISKEERQRRAKEAIDRVGLSGQYNKHPNQLSGGQCQRVAIARALVNEPEILLADEPTGALDTQTSVQIMELIKEIAKDKLVIMVTHNPELAEKYSSRIVRLLDGEVLEDSNPYSAEEEVKENEAPSMKTEKAKMSFWTAFKLSAKNLFSKRARTIMTCIAGSIGIIGVSMVLAVSAGVHGYIDSMQDDMLSGNPIMIQEETYDLNAFMGQMSTQEKLEVLDHSVNVQSLISFLANMFGQKEDGTGGFVVENTITKEYVDYIRAMPKEYTNAISYDYGINLNHNIYTEFQLDENSEPESVSLTTLVNMYTSVMEETKEFGEYSYLISMLATTMSQSLPEEEYVLSQYDLLGNSRFPKEKDEIMLVLDSDTSVIDLTLAQLGYYTQEDFLDLAEQYNNPNAKLKNRFTYDEIMSKTFMYYPNDVIYTKNQYFQPESFPFVYQGYSDSFSESDGIELKVVGILRPKEKISYGCLTSGFYYTEELTKYALAQAKNSEIVKYAESQCESEEEKEHFAFGEINGTTYKNAIVSTYHYTNREGVFRDNVTTFLRSNQNTMMSMLASGISASTSFGPSVRELGGVELPNLISIYPLSFEEKDLVTDYLDIWNGRETVEFESADTHQKITLSAEDRFQITYTDTLELIIAIINGMIDIVTTALIAFTALSLIVSCVMIAIITYVSVVERIKEIGVIRSLGGRKKDVSHLFNAETFIIGLISGSFGIAITYLASVILNVIVDHFTGVYPICALPWWQALIMILVSIVLTCISGLIPARSAAKKDPVVALRSE